MRGFAFEPWTSPVFSLVTRQRQDKLGLVLSIHAMRGAASLMGA